MRKQVEIVNKLGLHARPAALFVRYVLRFKSIITICKGEENFSAASLLEVLTANLNFFRPHKGRVRRAPERLLAMPLSRFRLADEQLGDGGIVDHDGNSVRRDYRFVSPRSP